MQSHDNYLMHHGVKGMHWGKRNGPPYPLKSFYKSPQEMSDDMKTWKYREFNKLQTPERTKRDKAGSCHDQVMYEVEQLKRMGYDPKTTFLFEHDGKGNGGETHSFVHYQDGKKHIWFENAWEDYAGLHEYANADEIKKDILMMHRTGKLGNKKQYPALEIVDFDPADHWYGEDLQDWVDNCFKHEK